MTEFGALYTDAWTSICAAMGALLVLVRLPNLIATPSLAWRFRACLRAIIVLMVFRVGHWADWGWGFSVVTFICSAILPLLALLLAEGMMRRHAPKMLKHFCGWGALIFGLLALRPSGWMEMTPVLGVLPFQLTALTAIAAFVVRRDKTLLSAPENQALTRVLLSFLLILPFIATDFLSPHVAALSLRLGGIAVLGLCLLTILLYRPSLSQMRIIAGMAGILGASVALTLMIAELSEAPLTVTFQIGAVVLSTIMLLATWQAARALVSEDRNMIILRAIASAPSSGTQAAVRLVADGADVRDALTLQESDLEDFDVHFLRRLFEEKSVRSVLSDQDDEQFDWLFKKYDATHAVCISTAPLIIMVFNNPALLATEDSAYGLEALQRMAAQIARSEGPC